MTARGRIWVAAPWAAAAVIGVLIARFSVRIHTLQPDENIAVGASRYVLDHPLSAIDPTQNLSGRGLERGVAVLFAAVQAIVGDTGHAYWVQHALGALIFGLGLTMTVAPLTATVLGGVDEEHASLASGVNNAIARVAGLVAIALVGAVVASQFASSLDTDTKAFAHDAGVPAPMRCRRRRRPAWGRTEHSSRPP